MKTNKKQIDEEVKVGQVAGVAVTLFPSGMIEAPEEMRVVLLVVGFKTMVMYKLSLSSERIDCWLYYKSVTTYES